MKQIRQGYSIGCAVQNLTPACPTGALGPLARVAELVDATVSNTVVREDVWVRLPPRVQHKALSTLGGGAFFRQRCEEGF